MTSLSKAPNKAVRSAKNGTSDMKRAGLFTMLLYVETERSSDGDSVAGKAFVFPGEPSEKDARMKPIQTLRFNDGMRTVVVMVYALRRVNVEFVKLYVRMWREGDWMKVDLRKTRTNNVART